MSKQAAERAIDQMSDSYISQMIDRLSGAAKPSHEDPFQGLTDEAYQKNKHDLSQMGCLPKSTGFSFEEKRDVLKLFMGSGLGVAGLPGNNDAMNGNQEAQEQVRQACETVRSIQAAGDVVLTSPPPPPPRIPSFGSRVKSLMSEAADSMSAAASKAAKSIKSIGDSKQKPVQAVGAGLTQGPDQKLQHDSPSINS